MASKLKQLVGFSLVEVIVAVGIFAVSIVGVVGLLAPTSKAVSDIKDADEGMRLAIALQAELEHLPFSAVSTLLKSSQEVSSKVDYSSDTKILFASRGGDKIASHNEESVWGQDAAEGNKLKFFEIVLIRNDVLSPPPDEGRGFLAFIVRLRWPAYSGDGSAFEADLQRSTVYFPLAISR